MRLALESPYTFVWHDNSGQAMPVNDLQVQSKVDSNGFTLDIPANSKLNYPLIIINSAAASNKLQTIVNVGANTEITLVEYMQSDDSGAQNEMHSIINCAAGAKVKHCILQYAGSDNGITQQATTVFKQQENSEVATNIFAFGGSTSKVDLHVALQGASAHCQAAHLACPIGKEKQEVSFNIEHLHPECTSNSIARSVVKDNAASNFIGKITVHPNACKTFADLQIKNLLCSAKAQANNKPELEIYNDDVKCSHGSSTGQLDQNALFYMRSRGIDLDTATEMLITGFIQPVLNTCEIPEMHEFVNSALAER